MTATPPLINRVKREKEAYDAGHVLEESQKIQAKFLHVFRGANSLHGEKAYQDHVKKATANGTVLNYGCYNGQELMETFPQYKPKKIVGIDISEKGIAEAKSKYKDLAEFHVMDAHHLTFPDNSFDLVVGRAILHHLDYEKAIHEVKRVLKPGGHAIFIEPLRDNPGAKLFRWLTPKARTKDELPLSGAQISWSDKEFGGSEHYFYNFFSIPAGMISTFIFKDADNFLMRFTHHLDTLVSKTPLKYWMRLVVLDWVKQ